MNTPANQKNAPQANLAQNSTEWSKVINLAKDIIPIIAIRRAWLRNKERCLKALILPDPEAGLKQACLPDLMSFLDLEQVYVDTFVAYGLLCGFDAGEAYGLWWKMTYGGHEVLDPLTALPTVCKMGWLWVTKHKQWLLEEPRRVQREEAEVYFKELRQMIKGRFPSSREDADLYNGAEIDTYMPDDDVPF